jgi:hypothetical protein
VTSYTLECGSGLFVNVQRGIEAFAYKNTGLPDCDSAGYNYNYSKPFQDYCNYKESCVLSTAFLDEKGLFNAETYFLTDDSLYLKPIRIDVYYTCLGKLSWTLFSFFSLLYLYIPVSSSPSFIRIKSLFAAASRSFHISLRVALFKK